MKLPQEIPRRHQQSDDKKELSNLIDYCYRSCGDKTTVLLADRLKDLGFKYATISGSSIAITTW